MYKDLVVLNDKVLVISLIFLILRNFKLFIIIAKNKKKKDGKKL